MSSVCKRTLIPSLSHDADVNVVQDSNCILEVIENNNFLKQFCQENIISG